MPGRNGTDGIDGRDGIPGSHGDKGQKVAKNYNLSLNLYGVNYETLLKCVVVFLIFTSILSPPLFPGRSR